ncbi:MAG: tetraacyldisaccharide 4-kinase [Bacteroidota bacterium]|jgi:tetraacyldisaccharide 4'-kinase
MSKKSVVHINKWLLPLAWLYGIVVLIRNKFFAWGVLKQKKYDIPVICVGNITVGGTGKTPHIEYLVDLLKPEFKVAVLSRGYKRKTKGFVLATSTSTAFDIGDEPYQIKRKYPDIIVAVDAQRQRGIETLLRLSQDQKPDVILLDDAFQHRYVKPSLSILLTDINRLMSQDALLPAGRLREPVHYAEKANMIVVTKCSLEINPLEQRIVNKDLQVYPYQDLFYTSFQYGMLTPVFQGSYPKLPISVLKNRELVVLTGIANPEPFYDKLRVYTSKLTVLSYPDHYEFKKDDISKIQSTFEAISGSNKLILTTEKDATRLRIFDYLDEPFKKNIYYLPIVVTFVNSEEQDIFNTKIIDHVRKNSRDS